MCGIAGIVAWDEKYRIKREQLQRMADALAHRGPDGEGFYLTHEDREITPVSPQCGLAFRRLAIIDPEPRSNQPFTIGHQTLVFNGEIYNYRELRFEISKLRPDYQWRTQGDTEVLLMSYAVWGEKCVEHLNGMFALAVWDDENKELFLARDRMGQKPLYVAYLPTDQPVSYGVHILHEQRDGIGLRALAFASELPGIVWLSWINRQIEPAGLLRYLQWGYALDSSFGIYRGISQVQPGRSHRVTRSGAPNRKYFDAGPTLGSGAARASRPADQTREHVLRAVRQQMVSDVPIGCFLSGGIDSSVIAAAMCAAAGDPKQVSTFSIGFDDPRYDESPYALRVAGHLGTVHRAFVVRPNAAEDLLKLAAVFGEPFGDSSALPTHYLARETRRHVKVALSGDGGDELFGGYDRYRAMLLGRRLRLLLTPLPWIAAEPLLARFAGGHPRSSLHRGIRFVRSLRMRSSRRYSSYGRLMDDELIGELLLNPGFLHPDFDQIHHRFRYAQDYLDVVRSAMSVDRWSYLPDDLLIKLDRASMLHGLEVRSPFMDHELVQFAAGLTTDQLLKGGPKRMLREAFAKDLPDFVFQRPKMGFAVPIGEWFRGALRPMLRENLFASDSFGKQHFNMKVVERLVDEHEQLRVDHSQRLYALLMLELWWRWHKSF